MLLCVYCWDLGPHVDSIKFSGKLICGLSLASNRILRLVKTQPDTSTSTSNKNKNNDDEIIDYATNKAAYEHALKDDTFPMVEIEVKRRSLYIIANQFRYNYTHEIIGQHSPHNSMLIPVFKSESESEPKNKSQDQAFDRRLSIMVRDELTTL